MVQGDLRSWEELCAMQIERILGLQVLDKVCGKMCKTLGVLIFLSDDA